VAVGVLVGVAVAVEVGVAVGVRVDWETMIGRYKRVISAALTIETATNKITIRTNILKNQPQIRFMLTELYPARNYSAGSGKCEYYGDAGGGPPASP
jgi:hypothetical protein